jgi:hypothetical protein
MNAQSLAQDLLSQVVDMNTAVLGRMLDDEILNADQPRKLDPQFQSTLNLYSGLTDTQKGQFLAAIRQTYIDSISEILGILDGSTSFKDWNDDWNLIYKEQKLNGSLQDYFLEAVENTK